MWRKISRRILEHQMKFLPFQIKWSRRAVFLCALFQFALAICVVAADNAGNSEDSSLQGELIEPIGKAPTNSAPVRTDKIKDGDFVGFDQLGGFKVTLNNELLFNTNRPAWADAQISAMIPARIRAADGKKISVDGFMIPLEYNGKKVSKFILAMNQNTCCFGGNPKLTDRIQIRLTGGKKIEFSEKLFAVAGTFHLRPSQAKGLDGGVIYHLDAEFVR